MKDVKNADVPGNALVIYMIAETLMKNIAAVTHNRTWKAYERADSYHILGILGQNRFRSCVPEDIPAVLGKSFPNTSAPNSQGNF